MRAAGVTDQAGKGAVPSDDPAMGPAAGSLGETCVKEPFPFPMALGLRVAAPWIARLASYPGAA